MLHRTEKDQSVSKRDLRVFQKDLGLLLKHFGLSGKDLGLLKKLFHLYFKTKSAKNNYNYHKKAYFALTLSPASSRSR
jgi:hypothetical protein